jgi:hypothetical protein
MRDFWQTGTTASVRAFASESRNVRQQFNGGNGISRVAGNGNKRRRLILLLRAIFFVFAQAAYNYCCPHRDVKIK